MKRNYILLLFVFSCFQCHQRPHEKIQTAQSCCTWQDIDSRHNKLDSALDAALERCFALEQIKVRKTKRVEAVSPQGPSIFITNDSTQ